MRGAMVTNVTCLPSSGCLQFKWKPLIHGFDLPTRKEGSPCKLRNPISIKTW